MNCLVGFDHNHLPYLRAIISNNNINYMHIRHTSNCWIIRHYIDIYWLTVSLVVMSDYVIPAYNICVCVAFKISSRLRYINSI